MRRLARHLFTLCSAASLLLAAALAIGWAHSHRQRTHLHYYVGERDGTWQKSSRLEAHAERGGCAFKWERHVLPERMVREEDQYLGLPDWDGPRKREFAYFPEGPPTRYPILRSPSPSLSERLGFQLRQRDRREDRGRRMRDDTVVVPFWSLCLAATVLPAFWLGGRRARRLRGKRGAGGLCARCGYDLRASPGPCPECGLARPPAASNNALT